MGNLDVELIMEDDGFKPDIGKQKTDKLVKRCHANFFSTSWQNDQTPMALGEYRNQEGVKSIYIMAPNTCHNRPEWCG